MANTIKQKRGTSDPGASDLVVGELAINTTDGGVFTKTDGGTVVEVGSGGGGASAINDLSDALTNNSGETIGLGTGALANDDGTDNDNTALGYNALNANTSGVQNVGIGHEALSSNTTGGGLTAIGYRAAASTSAPNQIVAIGAKAFEDYVGTFSLGFSVAIGQRCAMEATTPYHLTAVGNAALVTATTGGTFCTVLGSASAEALTTATNVTAIGYQALKSVTTGGSNTAVGQQAGGNITTGSNCTVLGSGANASSATATNEVTLGNSSVSTLRCNTQTISSLSDARDKTDVQELPEGLDFISKLNPVKFQWQTRDGNGKDGTYEAGFIAQELQSAQQDADADYLGLVMDSNPDRLEASYGKLVPMLVKAIQELKSEVEQLKANV